MNGCCRRIYNTGMTRVQRLTLGILIVLFSAGLLAWYLLTPRVVSFLPESGSQDLLPNTSITLKFSQPMDPTTIKNNITISPSTPFSITQDGATIILDPLEPFSQGSSVTVTVSRGIKSTLGLPISKEVRWSFGIKNAWLLYLLDVAGETQLYRMDPEGLVTDRLLDIPESVVDYSIVPGGEAILAVVQTEATMEIRYYNLPDGSSFTIYNCGENICSKPVFSPDMKYLAFMTGETPRMGGKGNTKVWLLTLNNMIPIGSAIAASGNEHPTRDPAWSTQGWLSFYDDAVMEFVFLQPSTGERKQVLSDTGEPGDWNAAGDTYLVPEVQYTSEDSFATVDYYSRLIAYKPATGERIPFTQNNQAEDALPVFSPDGSKVAFARRFTNEQDWTPGRQLWTINANGSNSRQLTNDPDYHHLGFSWSPDNTLLAYLRFNTANLNENREMWIIDTRTAERQRVMLNAYRLNWLP